MKFARFEYEGTDHFGEVIGDEVKVLKGSLITGYEETKTHYPISNVRLLPPAVPTKIICIGRNYRGHIEEIKATIPEKPHFFLKPPSSLIGHQDAIIYPRGAERVDYEGELAAVVKERMKDVPEEEALGHILGLTCFNDVTERAIVSRDTSSLTLAKGFDTFSCCGPYVVTDLDPNNLEVKTYLNGELMQHDNTKTCVFTAQQILSYLSHCMTLCPGDIISLGTPKGIAPMKPGDVVEVEIEGIGRLRNPIRRP